jgi:hypothetical protein
MVDRSGPVRRVECHSGYSYAQRPIAMHWEGERLVIEAVEAEWRTQEGRRFWVRTREGRRFDLRYVENEDTWHVIPA